MTATKAQRTVDLDRFGPRCGNSPTAQEAKAWCRQLTRSHGENFSVLSRFVAAPLVDDFSAVYSFCRCADDLGDETGSREESRVLLAWWRDQLHECFGGKATHPVFVALMGAIERHGLEIQPFDDLISAFELDQEKSRYETWDELLGYCRLSADPVGRIVLKLLGEPCDPGQLAASDAICTALQLTNHLQDARRDKLDRDRIYIPRESWGVEEFEQRLDATVRNGFAPDTAFLPAWREMTRGLVERTWKLYERGSQLVPLLRMENRALIWLFLQGGVGTLSQVQMWNYETCVSRPRLSRFAKAMLLVRARWSAQRFAAPAAEVAP